MLTGWPSHRIYQDIVKIDKIEGCKTKNFRIICNRFQCLTLGILAKPRGKGQERVISIIGYGFLLLFCFVLLSLGITGLYCVSGKLFKEVNKYHKRVK